MERLQIGKIAKRAGVSVDTVRYYESRGLIDEPPRLASGYRQYAPGVVDRIEFIKQAQELGFTLGDIEDLLRLRDAPDTTCSAVRCKAESKLDEIEEKLVALRRMKTTLDELVNACRQQQSETADACPILDAMEKNHES
jgi:MerR family mercuric resistance operon transcriptional regulator